MKKYQYHLSLLTEDDISIHVKYQLNTLKLKYQLLHQHVRKSAGECSDFCLLCSWGKESWVEVCSISLKFSNQIHVLRIWISNGAEERLKIAWNEHLSQKSSREEMFPIYTPNWSYIMNAFLVVTFLLILFLTSWQYRHLQYLCSLVQVLKVLSPNQHHCHHFVRNKFSKPFLTPMESETPGSGPVSVL